jgi:hypothetical protein
MSTLAPLDSGPGGGQHALVLLRELRRAVDAYCDAHPGTRHHHIADRAGLERSAMSRALAAGRPEDEAPAKNDPRVGTLERIASAVECRLMVIPDDLVPEVERILSEKVRSS